MYFLFIKVLAVASMAVALTFDCQYIEATWQGIGQNYQCQSYPFNVESTRYLTNVTGEHMAIHISGCTDLHYIPKGLRNFFPNLIAMYLQGCGVTTLNGTELNEYPELTLFALEMSPIKYVPGDLFAQTPDIFFVSFNDNKIKSVGRDLLRNLNKLSAIYFDNNTCIDVNTTTVNVTEFNENLNHQCSSLASEMLHSVTLQMVLLSVVACFGYNF